MNELVTIRPAYLEAQNELQKIVQEGLFLDRKEMRKLYNRMLKLDGDSAPANPLAVSVVAPGLKTFIAQLRGALNRKGWKIIAISAPSLESIGSNGITMGIIQ